MISIVIPCYNQAHFLAEAIESVLAQTWPADEIIVVDDGSTDNPGQVAARYPQVRCIRQENQGLPGARNTGLRESHDDYLVFLDADDRLTPQALAVGMQHLNARPECVMVAGHYRNIAADGTPLPTPVQPVVEKDHYSALLRGGGGVWLPATVLYRRSVFETVTGFDPKRTSCEDYDLYLRIARRFPICCHGQVAAEYRQHSLSMSRNTARMLQNAMAVYDTQKKYVNDHPEYAAAYREGRQRAQRYYGEQLVIAIRSMLREGSWKQGASGIWTLARYYPQAMLKSLAVNLYGLTRGIRVRV